MSKVAENLANMAQSLPAFDPWRVNVELAAHLIEQQAAQIAELEESLARRIEFTRLLAMDGAKLDDQIAALKAQQRGWVVTEPHDWPLADGVEAYAKAQSWQCDPIDCMHDAVTAMLARLNPPGKFRFGDPVRKTKGSQWSGRVVGFYATEQTPDGYAVESFTEKGSVQIYPGSALEPCEEPAECAGDQAGVMFGFNDKSVMVSQEAYQIFMDRERAYRDAYQGAREDLAIWKRRALEAEEKIRHQDQIIDRLTLEAQGETRFGEPVVGECVAVPRELLEELRDCANDCGNQAVMRGTGRHEFYERLTEQTDDLLAQQGKAVGDE